MQHIFQALCPLSENREMSFIVFRFCFMRIRAEISEKTKNERHLTTNTDILR